MKAAVIALAARIACAPSARCPKFNKMSGIQQWRNAVMLFVNVGGHDYSNVWLDGGRRIVWFAQPTQHEATPVIARLLAHAPRVSGGGDGGSGGSGDRKRKDDLGDDDSDDGGAAAGTGGGGASDAALCGDGTTSGAGSGAGAGAGVTVSEVDEDKSFSVLLFCRLPGEPYVFCGPLRYATHDARRRPLRFEWELSRCAELLRHPRGALKRMLAAA